MYAMVIARDPRSFVKKLPTFRLSWGAWGAVTSEVDETMLGFEIVIGCLGWMSTGPGFLI